MKTNTFELAKQMYMNKLRQFVPVVDRVHGKHHPEFHEVRRLFEIIETKVSENDLNLSDVFNSIKDVTKNYFVPTDVCESYEVVYQMLSALNKAYDGLKR
ncbi:MAG: iron-sulfur cluster repair di-iron protein, ric [Acholeplasma sp.]